MIDSPHKLGWQKNPPGDYPKARHVLGSRTMRMGSLPLLDKPNMLPFRSRRIDQRNANSCVAFDLVRRFQLYFAANGFGPNVLASARDLYFKGVAQEWAGLDPDDRPALQDFGTIPLNALKAVTAQGFALEADYPYDDSPDKILAEPPAGLYIRSYAQRGMRWGHIDEVADARITRVSDALKHRCPVGFGMMVDEAFLENRGQRISNVDPTRLVGGHMMTVLAVLDADLIQILGAELPHDARPGDVLVDNWWKLSWGTPLGFGVISKGVFGSSWVDDVSMLEAVPPVLHREEP